MTGTVFLVMPGKDYSKPESWANGILNEAERVLLQGGVITVNPLKVQLDNNQDTSEFSYPDYLDMFSVDITALIVLEVPGMEGMEEVYHNYQSVQDAVNEAYDTGVPVYYTVDSYFNSEGIVDQAIEDWRFAIEEYEKQEAFSDEIDRIFDAVRDGDIDIPNNPYKQESA